MKKIIVLLCMVLSIEAVSQKGKEDNPGQTAITSNPNSSGQINLISPAEAKQFNAAEINKPILFRWAPVVPRPQAPVTYRLRVWQLMQGQTGSQAMGANQPIVTKDVANVTQASITVLTGPCKPPFLCDFIWAVEALNSNDKESRKNYGSSGANTFKIDSGGIGTVTGSGGATMDIKSSNQGDPIYGVDVKLGFESKCDPIHGVDIKLGAIARNAQGDPVHGVDIKVGVKALNAQGDLVHGVDIKVGAVAKNLNAQGDPVHGVDVKLGAVAKGQGDPIHGVDVKLGFEGKKSDIDQIQTVDVIVTVTAGNAQGDPIHGVDVKLGVKSLSAQGDPVHGVDVKLGVKSVSAQGDPIYGVDVKLGATKSVDKELDKRPPNKSLSLGSDLHPVYLPIEKIIYDKEGNVVAIELKPNNGTPTPKLVVAGSSSLSPPPTYCWTVYCHNPLHPPGCGWQECRGGGGTF